jgi:hypothetical protein
MSHVACLNCGSSENERPLLALHFQSQDLRICPQCLPILIHKPYELADKLPGIRSYENPPQENE